MSTYCRNCGMDTGRATDKRILEGDNNCPKCGWFRPVDDYHKEVLVSMLERIEKLEEKVKNQ